MPVLKFCLILLLFFSVESFSQTTAPERANDNHATSPDYLNRLELSIDAWIVNKQHYSNSAPLLSFGFHRSLYKFGHLNSTPLFLVSFHAGVMTPFGKTLLGEISAGPEIYFNNIYLNLHAGYTDFILEAGSADFGFNIKSKAGIINKIGKQLGINLGGGTIWFPNKAEYMLFYLFLGITYSL